MKVCSKCRAEKPETEFSARISSRDGLYGRCRVCRSKYFAERRQKKSVHIKTVQAAYYKNNKAKHNAKTRAHYSANKAAHAAKCRAYAENNAQRIRDFNRHLRAANAEKYRAKRRQHYRENRHLYVANARSREKHIKRATPPWADLALITKFYEIRERLTDATGVEYHVDHIIPLRSKTVCGLHVPANLQVIPAVINLAKSNSLV